MLTKEQQRERVLLEYPELLRPSTYVRKKIIRPAVIYNYNCMKCKNNFQTKRPDTKFCCKKCRMSAYLKIYHKLHPDKRSKPTPEQRRKYYQSYKLNNYEKLQQARRNSSSLRRGKAEGKISLDEWKSLKQKYLFCCVRCYRKEPEIKLTLDHILPISRGGKNIIENAQPLCSTCNHIKFCKAINYLPLFGAVDI